MVTYEYECSDCGHNFEIEQSIKAKVKRKCPECGENTLERLISGGLCGMVRQEPTTLGQLGDINYKRDKNMLQEKKAREEESKPKKEKSWYEPLDREKRKKVNRMNDRQKFKYIMEGD